MKLFCKILSEDSIREKLKHLEHLDLSIFIELPPQKQEDLSSMNILVLIEPNEYFGFHDWAIQNHHIFDIILTWSDKVINNCNNAVYIPFGNTWILPSQYEKSHDKKFEIAHLSGILNKSYGHSMRHEIIERQNEIKIPTNFHTTIGDRHNIEDARIGKETVFGGSQFGVVIENFSHEGFFTEKILDCFLLKTIPVYWGCSDIESRFHSEGIIKFVNVDHFIRSINTLTKNYYEKHTDVIEKNYQEALKYVDYEQRLVDILTDIFKQNKLI